MLITGVILA